MQQLSQTQLKKLEDGESLLIKLNQAAVIFYESTEEKGFFYDFYKDYTAAKKDYNDECYENSDDGGLIEKDSAQEAYQEFLEIFGSIPTQSRAQEKIPLPQLCLERAFESLGLTDKQVQAISEGRAGEVLNGAKIIFLEATQTRKESKEYYIEEILNRVLKTGTIDSLLNDALQYTIKENPLWYIEYFDIDKKEFHECPDYRVSFIVEGAINDKSAFNTLDNVLNNLMFDTIVNITKEYNIPVPTPSSVISSFLKEGKTNDAILKG